MKMILPKLSTTMEEGTIVRWLKNTGDFIREGDMLYEIETDKTTMEVESSVTGLLAQIMIPAGKTIATGTELCEITIEGVQSSSIVQSHASNGSMDQSRIRISPSARRLARAWQIDIRSISGSGPMGRIRNRDIEAMVAELSSKIHTKPINPVDVSSSFVSNQQDPKDVSKMRMTLAKEMLRSTQTIPSFWVEKWVNADLVVKWKELLKQTRGQAFTHVTITDFILHAIGLALLEMPSVNRRWVENQQGKPTIQAVSGSHVGLAVSVDNGILSPILAHVGERLLSDLIQIRKEAVESMRNHKPYGVQEPAAITLSNLGNTGIDRFQAIIKPDETMILAVGGLQDKVVSVNGQFITQSGFNLVLSADHRVLDGIDAAKFLAKITEILETGAWKIA
jgi:pyruvate dehydrogenase E2 component (dihydrolipoamide acetyltransferase)